VKRKHNFTMKTNLQILIAAPFIAFSMARASAQQPVPIDPQTGLPVQVQAIDAATGLPADGSPPFKDSGGAPTWIDPSWKDPNNIQSSVQFLDLPLSEVARYMRERFHDYFDVILPNPDQQSTPKNPATGLPETASGFDPTQIDIDLQLKNVTAGEIFSAMNMQFELNKSPYRWELTMNGPRPTALLRISPPLVPPPPPPPQPIRKVFYVGYMLGDYPGTNDTPKLAVISDTVRAAWTTTGIPPGKIDIYPPGQLLIVSGTQDQVDLAEQTLNAIGHKADYDHAHQPQGQPPVNSQ
jgi:hypothetical protein